MFAQPGARHFVSEHPASDQNVLRSPGWYALSTESTPAKRVPGVPINFDNFVQSLI